MKIIENIQSIMNPPLPKRVFVIGNPIYQIGLFSIWAASCWFTQIIIDISLASHHQIKHGAQPSLRIKYSPGGLICLTRPQAHIRRYSHTTTTHPGAFVLVMVLLSTNQYTCSPDSISTKKMENILDQHGR